jgi:hypothetical protein
LGAREVDFAALRRHDRVPDIQLDVLMGLQWDAPENTDIGLVLAALALDPVDRLLVLRGSDPGQLERGSCRGNPGAYLVVVISPRRQEPEVRHLAKLCSLAESRVEARSRREDGDGSIDGQDNVRAERISGELPLTLPARILLFVGLNLASILIAFVERSPQLATRPRRHIQKKRRPPAA